MRHRHRIPGLSGIAALLVATVSTGCATREPVTMLTLGAGEYEAAFDAAIEAVRREGLVPALRDPRRGVIETEPAHAPTLVEPWRQAGESADQLLENTIAYQRRRARLEFVVAGPSVPPEAPLETTPEPDLLDLAGAPLDLTRATGPLELRVRAYLERAHRPGQRRSTWTRSKTTTTLTEAESAVVTWTPVGRDPALEQRLLARVQASLGTGVAEGRAVTPTPR